MYDIGEFVKHKLANMFEVYSQSCCAVIITVITHNEI